MILNNEEDLNRVQHAQEAALFDSRKRLFALAKGSPEKSQQEEEKEDASIGGFLSSWFDQSRSRKSPNDRAKSPLGVLLSKEKSSE